MTKKEYMEIMESIIHEVLEHPKISNIIKICFETALVFGKDTAQEKVKELLGD